MSRRKALRPVDEGEDDTMRTLTKPVRRDGRRHLRIAAFAFGVIICCASLSAQSASTPSFTGQWAGPWDLESQMTNDPNGVPYDPVIKEIAHSIVIPPASPDDAADPEYAGMVVFMNQRGFNPDPPGNYPPISGTPTAPNPSPRT